MYLEYLNSTLFQYGKNGSFVSSRSYLRFIDVYLSEEPYQRCNFQYLQGMSASVERSWRACAFPPRWSHALIEKGQLLGCCEGKFVFLAVLRLCAKSCFIHFLYSGLMFPVFWTKKHRTETFGKFPTVLVLVQVKILPKILIPHKTWVMSNPDPTTPKRLEANHHHPTQLLALHQVTLSQMCAHWQQMLYTNTIHYLCIPVILVKSWIRCLDQVELVCLYWYIYI